LDKPFFRSKIQYIEGEKFGAHNILLRPGGVVDHLGPVKSAVACALFLALVALARLASWGDVFLAGNVYFSDPDCYSRMTRSARVFDHPGLVVRWHAFENYPEGTRPHTTAVMDYLIAALAWGLSGATATAHPVDFAGAFIGPILAVAGGLCLWLWAGSMRLPGRWLMVLMYAASPILAHGGMLGRPDHQALLIPLMAVAMCSELSLARGGRRGGAWALGAGIAWGLGLWVSLYEPTALFVGATLIGMASLGGRFFSRDRALLFGCVGLICLVAWGIEGWRLDVPSGDLFGRWKQSIGELSPVPLASGIWWAWCGWGAALVVLGLGWRRAGWPLLAGLAGLVALTMGQVRWGYFFVLALAIAIPFAAKAATRWRSIWVGLWCLGLWPMLAEWDAALYGREGERVIRRAERIALRQVADAIGASGENGAILAPWWLSPQLAYWTGFPCVAGSSHESLPGIADTAAFWMTASADSAKTIAGRRRVGWVVADDPARVLPTAAVLLGAKELPEMPMVRVLYERSSHAPKWLEPVEAGHRFKVYRVQKD
jgi:hypothetical protein